ncbi:MAG: hypothetical protein IKS66_07070, partial [Oscillospiraceae bacterium]|nr:hypothetical protein [Oscillospiraceae bacterium]
GSYTLALMPASVRLDAGEALSDVPESWLFHVWPEVSLGKNEVAELESVRLTAEMNDNARYVTLPASTLSADRDSFADVSELVTFSGSIGLDARMQTGLLNQIYLFSEEPNRRGAPSMKLEAMVIDGKTYGADAFALGHGTYAISFSGAAIPLPCSFTIYCRPVDPGMNINFTMQVGGSCVYGAGHSVSFDRELVGTGTVYKPGAVIRCLSNDVCSDTVTVKGTARRNETVRIYDGEVCIGTATADYAGAWSATVTLADTDPPYMSVHRLHSETASGAVSEELQICHDPNGPELKRFTMSWDRNSWGYGSEIDVGSAYTTGSSGGMEDVTFRASFEHPEALASLGGDLQVMFKYYRYNGSVGFLDAAWDEAQGLFTATIPGYHDSAIFAAEVIYRPVVTGRGIDSELHTNADFFYDPDFRPETDFTLDAGLRENYLEGLERLTQAARAQHSAADSYTVRFAADGTASLSGSLPAGESLTQYTAAARALLEDGLHMARAGVRYGTPVGALQWLLEAAETWRTERPEEANVGKFSHVTLYPDRSSLRAALTGLADIADRQVSLSAAYDGGTALYDSYIFTDAETDGNDRLLGGSYFISVVALTDESQGVWMLSTGLLFLDGFTDYAEPLRTAAAHQSETAALLYELEIGHLPEWYNWAWNAVDSLSGAISGALGLANGIADGAKAIPRLSKLAGQGSGAMAAVNQLTSTVNYITASDKDAINQGDKINQVKNSPCYKKAMQWLYEQGMDDPNFDDGGLYDDQCRLIDAMRDVDFSGDLTGIEKASFYVNSACNAVAMYAAAGGPVSWGVGLAVTAGGLLFGKYAEKSAQAEKDAREFLCRRFMANSNAIMDKYAKEHPDDPDCQGHKKLEFTQPPPTMKVCYDPSGVVYEGVIENPVEGAAVTLYYAVDAAGNPVPQELAGSAAALVPADEVRDLVPATATQTTDASGRYAWFVPEGLWSVAAEKAGYAPGSSDADAAATVGVSLEEGYRRLLPVLPAQLDVNIPLVDRSAPVVEAERYTTDGVYVSYSKYMDEGDVLSPSRYTLSVRSGGDGEATPAEFTVESVDWGHAPSNLDPDETTYTKTVLLRVRDLAPGDLVHWSVDGAVRSYAGTALGGTFRSSGRVETQETLDAPSVFVDGAAVADGETVCVRRGALLELELPDSAAALASARVAWSA